MKCKVLVQGKSRTLTDYAMEGVTGYSPLTSVPGSILDACALKEMCPQTAWLAFKKTKLLSPFPACPAPSWGETVYFAQGQVYLCNALLSVEVLVHHNHLLDKLKRLCSLFTEIYVICSA